VDTAHCCAWCSGHLLGILVDCCAVRSNAKQRLTRVRSEPRLAAATGPCPVVTVAEWVGA
jgi:hypothetical protein